VYYTRGLTDVMQPVQIPRPELTPVDELITSSSDRAGSGTCGRRCCPGLIDDISPVERATATVTLDPTVLDRMSEPNRQRAIAQIVLTLTSFVTTDAGAIGFVQFEVDGEGFSVFAPGLGGSERTRRTAGVRRLLVAHRHRLGSDDRPDDHDHDDHHDDHDHRDTDPHRAAEDVDDSSPKRTTTVQRTTMMQRTTATVSSRGVHPVGAALPVLVDLDPQLEVDAVGHLGTGPLADLLEHAAALADHHALLALALDDDVDADAGPLPLGDPRGDRVRQLVAGDREELLADELGDPLLLGHVADLVVGEVLRGPSGSRPVRCSTSGPTPSPVFADTGKYASAPSSPAAPSIASTWSFDAMSVLLTITTARGRWR
jgi:hypothetical protein